MNKRSITGTTVGLGTAALLGAGGAGCPTPPTTGQPEPADAAVTQDAAVPEPPPVEPAEAEAGTATEPTATQDADESQLPTNVGGPAVTDDCTGPDQFTERCGYPSPARYAVLHPGRIRNG